MAGNRHGSSSPALRWWDPVGAPPSSTSTVSLSTGTSASQIKIKIKIKIRTRNQKGTTDLASVGACLSAYGNAPDNSAGERATQRCHSHLPSPPPSTPRAIARGVSSEPEPCGLGQGRRPAVTVKVFLIGATCILVAICPAASVAALKSSHGLGRQIELSRPVYRTRTVPIRFQGSTARVARARCSFGL